MALRPCLDCGTLSASARCASCSKREARRYERTRGSATARGYDSAWRRLRLTILERDGWRCAYCGKELIGSDATVDHVIPKVKGGSSTEPDNLVAACRAHNSGKRDKLPR